MVLRLISRSPRGPGFLAPVAPEKFASQELDASVGASGPHDFAVRIERPRLKALPASTASRPASVTFASRPSKGTGPDSYNSASTPASSEISEIQKLELCPSSWRGA